MTKFLMSSWETVKRSLNRNRNRIGYANIVFLYRTSPLNTLLVDIYVYYYASIDSLSLNLFDFLTTT